MKFTSILLFLLAVFALFFIIIQYVDHPPKTVVFFFAGYENLLSKLLNYFEVFFFCFSLYFLLITTPLLNSKTTKTKTSAKILSFCIVWFLISWWPHDYAHAHNEMGGTGLLVIEYGFHLTSMVVAAIAAFSLIRILKN